MLGKNFFPYTTLQEMNLDWILTKVKNILRFVPDDGAVGQILRRTSDGAEWSNEQGGGGAVDSVNGQTGTVVLTASDVGALPDNYTPSYPVTSVNTKTGAVVLDKSDIGLGNVANVAQYSASNPPPYPVTSVNGQTGSITITTQPVVQAFDIELSSNSWFDDYFDVSGNGILMVFLSPFADATSSGQCQAQARVFYDGTRIFSAGVITPDTGNGFSTFAACPIEVTNGKVIRTRLQNTSSSSTKIGYIKFICWNCSVTHQ